MQILVWVGVAVALAGLAGIIGCVVVVARAKRQGLDDNAMRARLQKVVVWNLGALFLSALGLIMVAVGAILA
ncbi:hypothetical protein [Tropicimonas sp.]|uniref:hypothetical protein n=1 Tax=Tropicimonas sp. TaxID=2067044 RepID=UPI003A867198